MKFVYMLSHSRAFNEETRSTILIGIYSSIEKAEDTISRYKSIEGFCDYPNDFSIEEMEVDFDDFEWE